MTRSYL